ncbi:hypothetical protein HW555_010454 [Spodoptera exigua]|uniref:Uncharacterized protein n=1 Tax=Spodoptera exigua TaxID=7107 RepID=A0A835G9F7_SPOEX|nr:hypothetical protein HW555_010454 [Spodoptera exigua]
MNIKIDHDKIKRCSAKLCKVNIKNLEEGAAVVLRLTCKELINKVVFNFCDKLIHFRPVYDDRCITSIQSKQYYTNKVSLKQKQRTDKEQNKKNKNRSVSKNARLTHIWISFTEMKYTFKGGFEVMKSQLMFQVKEASRNVFINIFSHLWFSFCVSFL